MTYHPAPKVLKDELPEVKEATVTYKFEELILRQNESVIQEKQAIAADSNFFKVFDYRIVQGSPENDADQTLLVGAHREQKPPSTSAIKDPLGQTIESPRVNLTDLSKSPE